MTPTLKTMLLQSSWLMLLAVAVRAVDTTATPSEEPSADMTLIIVLSVVSGIWCCCGAYAYTVQGEKEKGLSMILKVFWTAMSGVSALCLVGAIPNINRGLASMITAVINALLACVTCCLELPLYPDEDLRNVKCRYNTATGLLDAYLDFVVGWAFVDGFEEILEKHEDADYRELTTMIAIGTFIGFGGRLAEDIAEGMLLLLDKASGAELVIKVKLGLDCLSSMVAAGIIYPMLKGIDEEIQRDEELQPGRVYHEVVNEDGTITTTTWYKIFGFVPWLWIAVNLFLCCIECVCSMR